MFALVQTGGRPCGEGAFRISAGAQVSEMLAGILAASERLGPLRFCNKIPAALDPESKP